MRWRASRARYGLLMSTPASRVLYPQPRVQPAAGGVGRPPTAARLLTDPTRVPDVAQGADWGLARSLGAANALMSLSGHRRQQVWDAAALRSTPELLRDAPFN